MGAADEIRKMIRKEIAIEVMAVLEQTEDPGRVTLDDGSGDPLIDVPCLASYDERAPGDQVSVLKIGNSWLVLGANGKTPSSQGLDEQTVADMIAAAIPDVPPQVSVMFGQAAPVGATWKQAAVLPFVRDDGAGKRSIYFQLSTPADPPSPPPPPPDRRPKTVTITPNSHGSWRSNGQTSGGILQGNASAWGGSSAWWTGAIFYGDEIAQACSGRSVKSMTITIARGSPEGWNRRTAVHLGVHDRQTKGKVVDLDNVYTAARLAWGGKATVTLPSAIVNKLASGAARGVGIQYRGSSDYLSLTSGSGTIKISFN